MAKKKEAITEINYNRNTSYDQAQVEELKRKLKRGDESLLRPLRQVPLHVPLENVYAIYGREPGELFPPVGWNFTGRLEVLKPGMWFLSLDGRAVRYDGAGPLFTHAMPIRLTLVMV